VIVILLARLAYRTRSMTGAAASAAQRCGWASAGSPTCSACASLIWLNCNKPCPKAGCGLSSSINQAALSPGSHFRSPAELFV